MTQIPIPTEAITVTYAVTSLSTGPFVVPFTFIKEQDVVAIVTDALLVETVLVWNTDFIFTQLDTPPAQEGNGFTGGEITLNVGIGADLNSSIEILRSTVIERTNNYPNTGPFAVSLLNDEQNNHIAIMQELANNQAGGVPGAVGLQAVTDISNITNLQLVLHDDPQTQVMTIQQTLNTAQLTTTGGGIQFLGAASEYFFDTFVRIVDGLNVQSNGYVRATNSLGTLAVQMSHDDTWARFETSGVTPILIASGDGGFYMPEIAAAGASTSGFGQFWVNSTGFNPAAPFFTNENGDDMDLIGSMWDNATMQVLATPLGAAFRNIIMVGDDDNGFGVGTGAVYIADGPNAGVDFPNMGQFWVRSSSPVRPTFTNEDGDDQLIDPSISEIISVVASRVGILTDKGKTVGFSGGTVAQTMTIPAEGSVPHQIGTFLAWDNNGSVSIDIAITTDTLIFAQDASTGTRTIGPGGMAVALKIAAGVWKIDGAQVT